MQPKKYENPKIALLNVELELKAEKENAEVRVDNVEVTAFFFSYSTLMGRFQGKFNFFNYLFYWQNSSSWNQLLILPRVKMNTLKCQIVKETN